MTDIRMRRLVGIAFSLRHKTGPAGANVLVIRGPGEEAHKITSR